MNSTLTLPTKYGSSWIRCLTKDCFWTGTGFDLDYRMRREGIGDIREFYACPRCGQENLERMENEPNERKSSDCDHPRQGCDLCAPCEECRISPDCYFELGQAERKRIREAHGLIRVRIFEVADVRWTKGETRKHQWTPWTKNRVRCLFCHSIIKKETADSGRAGICTGVAPLLERSIQ